jgi:hypothetical protein
MITNASITQLDAAMALTNQKFNDNIKFKTIQCKGKRVSFTLTVVSSRGPGHRISHTGRTVAAACWHVHLDFMRNLFAVNPNCFIKSWMARYNSLEELNRDCGISKHKNIGSVFQPMNYGDACECH